MASRILIIEDNPVNMELFECLLEAIGCETITAVDAEAGIHAAYSERPDLVICDVLLPGVSGLEVARRLKRDPAVCGIPLVAVTAYAMVGDREGILSAGFDGYISKPIEPLKFLQQIKQILSDVASSGTVEEKRLGART